MFTTYFHERCSNARRLLVRNAYSVDTLVSAWSEVSLGWLGQCKSEKPPELDAEHAELDRIMMARSDVGPSFGGSNHGVWAMSLHILPRDELQGVWLRMLTFTRACVVWAANASSP